MLGQLVHNEGKMKKKISKNIDSLGTDEVLELLFAYIAKLSSLKEHDEILNVLAEMASTLTNADHCTIWIADYENKTLKTVAVQGVNAIEIPMDSGIVGSAIRAGKTIIIDDAYKDKRFNKDDDIKRACRTKSMMVVPMQTYSKATIGALQVINHQGERQVFDSRDMHRLTLVSTYTAETIISAKLHENLKKSMKSKNKFRDTYTENPKTKSTKRYVKVLGAYGTRSKNCATSATYLNSKNMIDAGNLIEPLESECAFIENIWITHSHLDHIVDIAAVMDNYFSLRKKPLTLFGLSKTIEAIKENFLNNQIWPDFSKIKLEQSEKMAVEYVEIELDKEYEIGENESIRAIKTDHTVASCGYIYTKDSKSILMTQDTHSIENIIQELNRNKKITAVVIECSFASDMEKLAIESKHLTPKLLFRELESLKREDVRLYINHLKPSYIEKIVAEIELYRGKWNPIVLKDGDLINF